MEKNDMSNMEQKSLNQQQQYQYQGVPMGNINMNVSGNVGVGVEKKGDLGKIAILLMTVGLLCCGLPIIPGIICAIIAFIKDKHNSTNIAAFVIALIECGIIGILLLYTVSSSAMKDMNINDIATDANGRIVMETKEDNGTLIYNDNDIEIYYNGLNSSEDFKFFFRNNSDKDIIVECKQLYLNGYDLSPYMHVRVPAGQKVNDTETLSIFKMADNDLSLLNLNKLEGEFTITDAETEGNIATFTFNID